MIDQALLNILLVEDDEDHARLVQMVLAQVAKDTHLATVPTGEEALNYLQGRGRYGDRALHPMPDLVLLDIRLPGMSGLEVLKCIKESRDLRKTPVVMLTSSSLKEDIRASYLNHANSYVVKPFGFEDFKRKLAQTGLYWLDVNQPPT